MDWADARSAAVTDLPAENDGNMALRVPYCPTGWMARLDRGNGVDHRRSVDTDVLTSLSVPSFLAAYLTPATADNGVKFGAAASVWTGVLGIPATDELPGWKPSSDPSSSTGALQRINLRNGARAEVRVSKPPLTICD